jgi:hypothetical protein
MLIYLVVAFLKILVHWNNVHHILSKEEARRADSFEFK